MTVNEHLLRLPSDYLFTRVSGKVADFRRKHPGQPLIPLGIGDVPGPLVPAAVTAMCSAAREMGTPEGFRGYGPSQGYRFLREAIAAQDYLSCGIPVTADEIFISDGSKTDCSKIGDLFSSGCRIGVCDPTYPVYAEAAAISGRAGEYDPGTQKWSGLTYLPCTADNGFFPAPPQTELDLVFLCSPGNPTGCAATSEQLRAWVEYAKQTGAVLLYDGAYEAFITSPDVPHSIYEVPGAASCAIELRSFSKSAGFTGVRCAWTVIPEALTRGGVSLRALWARRQDAGNNGTSYLTQRGAEAVCLPEGRQQIRQAVRLFRQSAQLLSAGLRGAGLTVYGGTDSPYLWVGTPDCMTSWSFFDLLLEQAGIITTPGSGFGSCGEGYVRISSFIFPEQAEEAVYRIAKIF